MEVRTCTSCGKAKPEAEFYAHGSTTRRQCKACMAKTRERRRAVQREAKFAVDRERVRLLPAEPFRRWLLDRLPNYETYVVMAKSMGIAPRIVFRLLQQNGKQVSLDTVDRALVSEGSMSLSELYPDESQVA